MFRLFPEPQKVFFRFGHHTGLTLAEVFAGAAGEVVLGPNNVALWSPVAHVENSTQEIIYDFRFEPLILPLCFEKFQEAARGRLLPAHVALFKGNNAEKIAEALAYFDYVLVPDTLSKIRNLPADFQNRVISYSPMSENPLSRTPKTLDL